uniref:Uncharacterized protein n=1 Tax=Kalanchoe fedtschenkoi TaxID=63787 RepID=A0A7N0TIW7_KALFE
MCHVSLKNLALYPSIPGLFVLLISKKRYSDLLIRKGGAKTCNIFS